MTFDRAMAPQATTSRHINKQIEVDGSPPHASNQGNNINFTWFVIFCK